MENIERGRQTLVLAVENVHGYIRGKDAKFPMLRKNLGYSVADEENTYVFGEGVRELSLTQQDEVKSVVPDSSCLDRLQHWPESNRSTFPYAGNRGNLLYVSSVL